MSKVAILMSTYNGEKYIKEQIDSLVLQKGVELDIIIRDDGSKDSTVGILQEYVRKYSFITVLEEHNLGVSKSFDRLCRYACENNPVDYYAFCDQDDVWDDDKLVVALEKLKEFPDSEPNLYFSNLKMVDGNLDYMRNQYSPGEVRIGSPMALIQVFTYGCTCVFNRKALEIFCAIPENNLCHDHWIYELCTYMGNVYYDENSHINYRRHDSNVSGIKTSGWELLVQRFNTFRKGLTHNFDESAKQILFFGDKIKPQYYDYVYKVAHYREKLLYKLWLLTSPTYRTGNFSKDLTIIFRILINKL